MSLSAELGLPGEPTAEPELFFFGLGVFGFCLRLRLVGTHSTAGASATSTLAGAINVIKLHGRHDIPMA